MTAPLDMRPRFTDNRSSGSSPRYAKSLPNGSIRHSGGLPESAHCTDSFIGQLGNAMALAFIRSAVPDSVPCILQNRAPNKIRQMIIRWIAVKVSRLHPRWCWTDERFQYQPVNPSRPGPILPRQVHKQMPGSLPTWRKHFASPFFCSVPAILRSHAAKVRDLITPLVLDYCFPMFSIHAATISSLATTGKRAVLQDIQAGAMKA